jgi:hypothetical protein
MAEVANRLAAFTIDGPVLIDLPLPELLKCIKAS